MAQMPEAIRGAGGLPPGRVISPRQSLGDRLIQAQPGMPVEPLLVRERLVLVVGEREFWFQRRYGRRWQGERAARQRWVLMKHRMTFLLRCGVEPITAGAGMAGYQHVGSNPTQAPWHQRSGNGEQWLALR